MVTFSAADVRYSQPGELLKSRRLSDEGRNHAQFCRSHGALPLRHTASTSTLTLYGGSLVAAPFVMEHRRAGCFYADGLLEIVP